MISCEWKRHGCTRMFSSLYAMRVHQRSCSFIRKSMKKRSRPTAVDDLPSADFGSRFRLNCDFETFQEMDNCGTNNAPPFMEENDDLLNTIGIVKEGTGRGHTKVDIDERLVTSAMIMMARLSRKAGRKAMDDIIRLFIEPEFSINKLQVMCRSVADCIKMENEMVSKTFSDQGFRRVTVHDEGKRIQCDLYVRSPIKLLTNQISGV